MNPPNLSRRQVSAMLLSTPALLASGLSIADPTPHMPAPDVEARSLDEIHRAALIEGGKLVVYAGGDVSGIYANLERAFMARFPGMSIQIIVDFSKYHDQRIDLQLAKGRLEADVAVLQTLHDFDRWKAEGKLLAYKPLDWDMLLPESKDPDGAYHGIGIIGFSNNVNSTLIPADQAPRDALDYLDPKLKGRLALTYPHDDDAVLYQFDRIVGLHGWEYMERLIAQDALWMRGTVPARMLVQRGERAATFTASGALVPASGNPLRFQLPRKEPFLSWTLTAAMFKETKNKEAARLYLSWLASKEATLTRNVQWSVRRDVLAVEGFGPIWNYNTSPAQFRAFMQDRARVERLKTQFEHLLGPVIGPNPTGVSGLYLLGG